MNVHELLAPVLCDERIMGSDLYQVGLGEMIEKDFAELIAGPGAVRRTLQEKLVE